MSYKQNLQDLSEKPEGYHTQYRPEMMKYIPVGAKKYWMLVAEKHCSAFS
jgi:hypothetical protein